MNPQVTKDWAEWQNTIFAGTTPDPAEETKWIIIAAAQEQVCYTNLTFRQRIIRGDLEEAKHQFDALRRNGYWVEGYGYMAYSAAALGWAAKRGRAFADAVFPMMSEYVDMVANYSRLVFPDGSLPLPEVSADVRPPFDPLTAEDDYEDACYRVHRWFTPDHSECIAQILICKDTDPEPRLNFHHHPECGYFCLWIKGVGFINRIDPYTGFDAIRNVESSDVAKRLPRGAIHQTWRLNPPEVQRSGLDFQWSLLHSLRASRSITWIAGRVNVNDNGRITGWDIPSK